MTPPQPESMQGVSLFDARPFFEKALVYGVQHGLIDQAKLDAIAEEAPRGMVQIARYFGSEYLRPELEKARDRLVNLVSLHLQDASSGDLRVAATLLRDHSLLSRSKAGSDLLKALIVMPQNTHFGMNERGGFSDRHIPQLARWSLASYADYQAEFLARQHAVQVVEAALWFADQLGLSADDLQDAEPDAEAVIRTALLLNMARRKELPDWVTFRKNHHCDAQTATRTGAVDPAQKPAQGLPRSGRDRAPVGAGGLAPSAGCASAGAQAV